MALIEKLTNIADAIREKTGGTEKLSLDGMAEAIAGISVGGGDEQSVLDSLIDRSLTEIQSNVGNIGHSAFYNCTQLNSVDFPIATSIEYGAFQNCGNLTYVDFPNVTSIGNNAFYRCFDLPCVDFPFATSIGNSAFNNCTSLKSVILRSTTVCTLANTNAFSNCYHYYGTVSSAYNPEGLKDGYIYVPRALLSDDDSTKDYRRATNWSTLATQFRALEDYTVDGTTTGALDESKI